MPSKEMKHAMKWCAGGDWLWNLSHPGLQSHTGYLTFARLVPYVTSEEAKEARKAGASKRRGGGGGGGGGEGTWQNDDELSD